MHFKTCHFHILHFLNINWSCLFLGHRAAWSNHGRPLTIFLVDGKTMVDQEFQKSVFETLGPGSNPGSGNCIFYFFNIFWSGWSLESSQCKNFVEKVVRYFFIAFFTQKIEITFLFLNISPKFLHWDDSELQPNKIH